MRRAVLDYVEGFYQGDENRLRRSVSPDLQKFGFWWSSDSTRYLGEAMSWSEAIAYTRSVRERRMFAPPDAPREVTVFDVQDQTASAKVVASWGTDYLLLAKYGEVWMVREVLWQTPARRP